MKVIPQLDGTRTGRAQRAAALDRLDEMVATSPVPLRLLDDLSDEGLNWQQDDD